MASQWGTFNPELPSSLALVHTALDVVEPVPDALLQPQIHPSLRLLSDADGQVTSLVQESHSINVGQLQLKYLIVLIASFQVYVTLNRNSPISDSLEQSFLKQWK